MANTDHLIETLSADMVPVSPGSHPYVLMGGWIAGFIVYVGIMMVYFGLRDDLMTKLHDIMFAAELVSLAILIVSSALSALLLSYPDLYQKRLLVFVPLPVLFIFVGILILEWLKDVPPSPMPEHGMECLSCISGLSLLPAAVLLYHMRKLASTHYYAAGSIALISAFSIGALILRLFEKTDSIRHIVEWHYLPMAGIALVGLLLGKIFLRW